jgi:hypothetical protein
MNRPAIPGLNLHCLGESQRNRSALLRLWHWTIALGSVQMAALCLDRISFGVR